LQNTKHKYHNQQGKIELETIDVVEAVPEKEKLKYPHCFRIVTKPRTYIISPGSQSEMNKWITAITDAKAKHSKAGSAPKSIINPELENKQIAELEQLLIGVDSKMNEEVKVLLDDCSKDKDMILQELMRREIELAKAAWLSERQLISQELRRKQTVK
jgi:hypothetical protein